jgi:uncharacterized protein YceK
MRIIPVLIIGATVMVNSGCTSLIAHENHNPQGPYAGVRRWPSEFTYEMGPVDPFWPLAGPAGPIAAPFLLVDLPLSFGLDTMLLPADLLPKKSGSVPSH